MILVFQLVWKREKLYNFIQFLHSYIFVAYFFRFAEKINKRRHGRHDGFKKLIEEYLKV